MAKHSETNSLKRIVLCIEALLKYYSQPRQPKIDGENLHPCTYYQYVPSQSKAREIHMEA